MIVDWTGADGGPLPIWSGGCCSASASPPQSPWRRCRRRRHGGLVCWPRCGHGWPCPPGAGTFAMALPCLVAVWMLSGFYLLQCPSLAARVLGSSDLLWGGGGDLPAPSNWGRGLGRGPWTQWAHGHAGRLPDPAHRHGGDPRRHRDDVGCRFPGRDHGGGRGLRGRRPGRLPDRERPGPSWPAGQPGRRVLHRCLRGVQCPHRGRRGGRHPLRPAPDRSGLRHGDRRAYRGGGRQPDLPPTPPRCNARSSPDAGRRRDRHGRRRRATSEEDVCHRLPNRAGDELAAAGGTCCTTN